MRIGELEEGDSFEVIATGVQYTYDGYKNYHRMGFMHWGDIGGVKTALNYKTEVTKL